MKNVLIADDHWIVRAGISMVVQKAFATVTIAEADCGDAVIQMVRSGNYDLIILDLMMPETDAVELLRTLQTHHAKVPVLIMTMNSEQAYGKRFIKLGAKGFIKKDAPEEQLIKAINAVANGGKYVSYELMEQLTGDYFKSNPSENPFEALSVREFQIATSLAKGLESSEISQLLAIQHSTVNTHRQRIYEKLNVRSPRELTELARAYSI